ncbi:MAG TPA: dihydroxy-acid dehydratase [Streptosporangiaceae bacterium]|nr:dihydroxy-acid dehydratase [Streptosporangiaceae bacterium]
MNWPSRPRPSPAVPAEPPPPAEHALRSQAWLTGDDEVALEHRAALRPAGLRSAARAARPVIGIACTASDLNRCDRGLDRLAEAVRSGVLAAGGLPLAFPVMSLSEDLMKPTAMLYRNLLAIEVEETIRSQPLDGIVALGNCDKTVPAYLMALASADIPALVVTGGFRVPATFRGGRLGSGTSLWQYYDARRSGLLSDAEWTRLEVCLGRGLGACNTMGTASSMAIVAEALGMMLPGTAVMAAGDPRQLPAAEAAGRRIVAMTADGVRPSAMLTPSGFGNAIAALAAVGGSTNAIIHLCAVAGRRALTLPLRQFAEVAAAVPVIADISPAGAGLMPDLASAGGLPAVLAEIAAHLDLGALTAAGVPLGEALAGTRRRAGGAIRAAGDPVTPEPAFTVVRGNLAPDGAVIKTAAASPALLRHRGPAVVFRSYQEMRDRIDDPGLDVTPDSVLVLAGCGPVGAGMPEWGMIPIPRKLLEHGVTDMLRITDGRMSGTSFGTVVLHVAPESAVGGPLARIMDGDMVSLDAAAGGLTLEVGAASLAARRPVVPAPADLRGWPVLHRQHVTQAPEGCDYDFLQARTPEQLPFAEPVIGRS